MASDIAQNHHCRLLGDGRSRGLHGAFQHRVRAMVRQAVAGGWYRMAIGGGLNYGPAPPLVGPPAACRPRLRGEDLPPPDIAG